MSQEDSQIEVKKGQELVEKAGKEAIWKTITALVGDGFMALVSSVLLPLVIIIILLCIIPAVIFSSQYVFNDSVNASQNIENNITEAVIDAYKTSISSYSTKSMIVNQLNVKYSCNGTTDDLLQNDDGSYYYKTDRCEIIVNFTPDVNTVSRSIAAYVTAVDGTLTYYEDNPSKIDSHIVTNGEGNISGYDTSDLPDINDMSLYFDKSEDGNISASLAEGIKEYIQSSVNVTFMDGASEEYAEQIHHSSADFFRIEDDHSLWLGNTIQHARIPHKENVCYLIRDIQTDEGKREIVDYSYCENEDVHYQKEEETVYLYGYKGNVTIPVNYDATSYKKNELEALSEKLVSKGGRCIFNYNNETGFVGTDECNNEEADIAVSQVLYNYYASSLQYFGLADNDFYASYISGNPGYSGEAAYLGGLDYKLYAGKTYPINSAVGNMIWNHARNLHAQGKIHGSTTDPIGGCTFFAQMWFYDHYGYNQSGNGPSGNGKQWAEILLETYPDKFERGSGPAPGGVVSIDYGRYGHIVCIDAVDYEAGTVTYSEGNYDGKGSIRIMNTTSLADFFKKWKGMYIYVNAK